MSVDVDKTEATMILNASYAKRAANPTTSCPIKETIDFVMNGKNCLTYRYVMFTAFVAKATNQEVDVLSLQVKDKSPGSYDARTLAKEVVFPFQKTFLGNVLDGSNADPLVNKPARFERLSADNPVAGGDPKKALAMLCSDLPKVKTKGDALACVDYVVSILSAEKEKRNAKKEKFKEMAAKFGLSDARRFLSDVLDQNFGGASLVIVATAVLEIAFDDPRFEVTAHPTNQSGSSKRQFGDVDVRKDGIPYMSVELKDKPFSSSDVDHAAETACKARAKSLLFVAGRQSTFASPPPAYFEKAKEKYAKKGIFVGLCSIDSLVDAVFASHVETDPSKVLESVRRASEAIGAIEAQMWIYERMETIEKTKTKGPK